MNSDSSSALLPCPPVPGEWVFGDDGRRWLESDVLPRWLPTRRWFGGKARAISRVEIEAAVPICELHRVLVVRVEYASGEPERYAVPLGGGEVLHDAVEDAHFRAALLAAMRERKSGALAGEGSAFLDSLAVSSESRVLGVEQSNTSIVYGETLFLKLFRRLQPGVNPDAEISRFLGARGFAHVAPFAGTLELWLRDGAMPFGLMLGCVENDGDAWAWALRELRGYYDADTPVPLERIALLGQRTAELHLALATGEDADFAPEPLTREDFEALAQSVSTRLDTIFAALRGRDDELVREVLGREPVLRVMAGVLAAAPPAAMKTRHHGDFHLGQVLSTCGDWTIIDFEGEPSRPLAERRAKRSPLRDVAGMLRSFHYAAHAARGDAPIEKAEAWSAGACAAFLKRYLAVAEGAVFLPRSRTHTEALLDAFVLEKALYEIDYELNNRPDWLAIPLRGLLAVTAH